ncbi:hypothetical protein BP6252_13085 [Coleophoma cylindrospora]|uniref:Apple domain-containing protein n=1 Tax=Coleophoma cylindrospora TaxID=1849047 RepID=A0A3D8Q9Y3_9HELO|nr:hypothetical protein BP6252_13085 [Coleophoma cylindrospora]
MRAALVLQALVACAAATPLVPRQDIDFNLVDDTPDPAPASIAIGPTAEVVTYNLAEATASATVDPVGAVESAAAKRGLSGRAACDPQPTGAGFVPSPDSASAFLAAPTFAALASAAPTPSGYTNTFTNLQGSVNAYGYLGYTTLTTYDTAKCATKCNAITGCVGINVFFERDPTVSPGTGCTDPASTTVIKCTFWGGYVAAENALNVGQYRSQFHVVIAGSNGYMSNKVPSLPGYTAQALGNYAINAPLDCNGKDTYMGVKLFTTSIFDVGLCAAACAANSAYNVAHPPSTGSPDICTFFNTYLLSKNGVPQGQYCSLYTEPWDISYAVNSGQTRGKDKYTVSYSFSYSNTTTPGTPVCSNNIAYLQSVGSDFCTSYINYVAPTTTVGPTETSVATITASATTSTTDISTVTSFTTTTITGSANGPMKRDATSGAESDYSIAIETIFASNPNKPGARATASAGVKRAIATPASIAGWPAASISAACSQVATGTVTVTTTATTTVSTTSTTSSTVIVPSTVTATATSTFTVPGVLLASPTAIVGSLQGSPDNYDDPYFSLTVPFPIGAYGSYSTSVSLSINGRLCIGDDSGAYANAALPDTGLPNTCVLGYYDDLYIYQGTQQGIYYEVTGAIGSRKLVFEYYVSHYQQPYQYYHFTMSFYEATPGVTDVVYYSVSDFGASATVGAQRLDTNQNMQYEFNTNGTIYPGLTLKIDSTTGLFTPGAI